MNIRTRLAAAGLVAAAVLTTACGLGDTKVTNTDTVASAPTTAVTTPLQAQKVGAAITVQTGQNRIDFVLTRTEHHTTDNLGYKPSRGGLLLAHFKVTVAAGSTFVCSCQLHLVEADGSVYTESHGGTFDDRPPLNSVELVTGQSVQGWVQFDIAKSRVKGSRVQLSIDDVLTSDGTLHGYWQL